MQLKKVNNVALSDSKKKRINFSVKKEILYIQLNKKYFQNSFKIGKFKFLFLNNAQHIQDLQNVSMSHDILVFGRDRVEIEIGL